jgi:hypothetical protein
VAHSASEDSAQWPIVQKPILRNGP